MLLVIYAYFTSLTIFAKALSYQHFQVGALPVYIGELMLALAIAWSLWTQGNPLKKVSLIFSASLAIYFFFGMARAASSLLYHRNEYGVVQILQDSALFYQSLWVIFGIAIARHKEWRGFLGAILLGATVAQVLGWTEFLTQGFLKGTAVSGIGFPDGNEVVSGLFPLVLLLLNNFWSAVIAAFFGHSLLGQAIFYLKRNWVFTVLVMSVPLGVFWPIPGKRLGEDPKGLGSQRRWKARARALLIGMLFGTGLAGLSAMYVNYRSDTGQKKNPVSFSFLQDSKTTSIYAPEKWLFHGEMQFNDEGKVLSYMGWRAHLWSQAGLGFLSSPLYGNGCGPHVVQTLVNGEPAMHDGKWISGPHNSFLTVLFRGGLMGFLPLLGMLLSTACSWWKRRRSLPWASWPTWSDVSFACLVSVSLYALFNVCLENPYYGTWFWVFLGAAAAFSDPRAMEDGFLRAG